MPAKKSKRITIYYSVLKSVIMDSQSSGIASFEIVFDNLKPVFSREYPSIVVSGSYDEKTGHLVIQSVNGTFCISFSKALLLLKRKDTKNTVNNSLVSFNTNEKPSNQRKPKQPSIIITGFTKTKDLIEVRTYSLTKRTSYAFYYETISKAEEYLRNPNYEDADLWIERIKQSPVTDIKLSPKYIVRDKTCSKNKASVSTAPDELKEKTSRIKILSSKNRVLIIKIDGYSFYDFDDAIKYVQSDSQITQKELSDLKRRRDDWYKKIWIPRIRSIISNYSGNDVPFTELFSLMNKLYKKDFSEQEAADILSLCKESVVCRTESDPNGIGKDYYYSIKAAPLRKVKEVKHFTRPQPITKEAVDESRYFKKDYFELLDYPFVDEKEDVYVGLDFGTSFTKAAYQYDINNKGIILFGDSPFKSTVVYLTEDNKLSFFRPDSNSRQIQFFKATMVQSKYSYSELRYNDIKFESSDIKSKFEMLCSGFFIANILCYIKHKLTHQFGWSPCLQVAMGVPLFGNTSNDITYNQALHFGLYISERMSNPETISLRELNDIYKKSMESFDNNLYAAKDRFQHCTVPELFTEAIYLLNRTDFLPGYYYIVDIGGGTSDFAFIHKQDKSNSSNFNYFCPSATVAKLGNEVRKACDSDTNAKNNYLDEYGKAYRTTIAKGKFGLGIYGNMKIKQLLFGGGSIDPSQYYRRYSAAFQNGLNSISCTVEDYDSDSYNNSFIPPSLNLSREDKQRLIIATQLAIPETSDAYLSGRPDDYDHTPKPLRKTKDIEDNNPGYDSIG